MTELLTEKTLCLQTFSRRKVRHVEIATQTRMLGGDIWLRNTATAKTGTEFLVTWGT